MSVERKGEPGLADHAVRSACSMQVWTTLGRATSIIVHTLVDLDVVHQLADARVVKPMRVQTFVDQIADCKAAKKRGFAISCGGTVLVCSQQSIIALCIDTTVVGALVRRRLMNSDLVNNSMLHGMTLGRDVEKHSSYCQHF